MSQASALSNSSASITQSGAQVTNSIGRSESESSTVLNQKSSENTIQGKEQTGTVSLPLSSTYTISAGDTSAMSTEAQGDTDEDEEELSKK